MLLGEFSVSNRQSRFIIFICIFCIKLSECLPYKEGSDYEITLFLEGKICCDEVSVNTFFHIFPKETCSEYRALMKNGKLFCSQDKLPVQSPDGIMFVNKCAMCKMIL